MKLSVQYSLKLFAIGMKMFQGEQIYYTTCMCIVKSKFTLIKTLYQLKYICIN